MHSTRLLSVVAAILLLTVVFAGLVTAPASAAQENAVQGATLKYKGVAYVSYKPNEYASTGSHSSLNAIKSTGANYVSVLVTQYVSSRTSNVIFPEPDLTPTDAAVINSIRDIHARGMGVLLKPQLDCDYVLCGGEGDLAPTNPSAWFKSYATFINHYARIAQNNGVELFCVGCEYSNLDTSKYYANWRTVISGVRTIYHGPLTYGADYGTYARIPFWGLLDYAGIDAYFPLSDTKTPSVTTLVNGWSHYVDYDGTHNWTRDIEVWQAKTHKRVVFLEIGYRSINYAAKDPGNWEGSGVYNANGQANCYEAAMRVFANKPWFAGMFWWGWHPDPNAGGAGDTDYTPQHKPAQGILTARWLPLGRALDNTTLTWTTGGYAQWFGETTTSFYGGSAAQSGKIGDNQNTWLRTTVTGPGTLTFYWRVSSEQGGDWLRFSIDGRLQGESSGSRGWTRMRYSVGAGTHTLIWKYSNDMGMSVGADAGWVDKVTWTKG